jgi:predicted TIM-barrel fold metal-dependent hydrolase
MHAAGVRGVRFNLVSPVGSVLAAAREQMQQLAPALRARGWHVQWYTAPANLPTLANWQAECGLPFVLDHLAGLTPAHAGDEAAWDALRTLAAAGSWIKLSGWYRLQADAPYDALDPVIRRVATLFDERMVWGSDWPHTSFAPDALPAYDSVWQPVGRALGEHAARTIRAAGVRLYA